MKRVAEDIIVETDYQGANVSCILTEGGKVLVDTPYYPQEVKQWQQAISEAGEGDVAYIINTDHHFDHTAGNCHFCPNVVGHVHTYEEMCRPGGTLLDDFMPNIEATDAAAAEEIKGYPLVPPNITFDHSLTLHMGDKTLQVIHMGGHTPATSVVYIPELRALLTGDVVWNDTHPFMGQAHIGQWMGALETVKGMVVVDIVPGHGEVCGMNAVDRLMHYFRELRQQVEELIKAGKSRDEAAQQVDLLGYFPVDEETRELAVMSLRMGAERLYDEIRASS